MLPRAGPIGGTLKRATGSGFFALLRATSLKTPAAVSINAYRALLLSRRHRRRTESTAHRRSSDML
jgi:hypothetical protein